jgi:hypothetical protein
MKCKRYLPPEQLQEFLSQFDTVTKNIGFSVQNRPIKMLKIGSGPYKILIWSQMHGNESTTTKALLDLIPWFIDVSQDKLHSSFTLYIIPQLNPDGSLLYTRNNANNIDLNRDAIKMSQPESKALKFIYEKIKPNLCLNLHGQQTIYSAGKDGKSAILSFLAPAADLECSITRSRRRSMEIISGIVKSLEKEILGSIGRYDETFNPNCVGDSFSQSGTPTILFEAGHVPDDYQREKTRLYIFEAFKALFISILHPDQAFEPKDYLSIPNNEIEFCDLILSGVNILVDGNQIKNQKIAIQYRETLIKDSIYFLPEMKAYGTELDLRAHKYTKLPASIQNPKIEFKDKELIKNRAIINLLSLTS